MKVAAYHSSLMEDERNKNVYHDHDDCPDGLRINAEHKDEGTDNRKRCEECTKKG